MRTTALTSSTLTTPSIPMGARHTAVGQATSGPTSTSPSRFLTLLSRRTRHHSSALGAETYALTHSPNKAEDAKKLGAKDVIVTTEKNFAEKWAFKFDFLLNCADMTHTFDMKTYMSMLKVGGEFHMVGIPDHPLPEMAPMAFTANAPKLSGSHLGNNQEMNEMLKLAAEKGIKPMVETLQLSEAGCKEAVERVKDNKVHYRFTLVGFNKAFGKK